VAIVCQLTKAANHPFGEMAFFGPETATKAPFSVVAYNGDYNPWSGVYVRG
jgi:hypothetical protein